jgi:uncharacterized glyoxalase superfamily protein PhnB
MDGKPAIEDHKGRLIYPHNGSIFMVTDPIDSQPATHANGATIGFSLSDPGKVDGWHRAGVENGGTSIEDPPGIRHMEWGDLYLAYLRDPDGNKLCAVHRVPAEAAAG